MPAQSIDSLHPALRRIPFSTLDFPKCLALQAPTLELPRAKECKALPPSLPPLALLPTPPSCTPTYCTGGTPALNVCVSAWRAGQHGTYIQVSMACRSAWHAGQHLGMQKKRIAGTPEGAVGGCLLPEPVTQWWLEETVTKARSASSLGSTLTLGAYVSRSRGLPHREGTDGLRRPP